MFEDDILISNKTKKNEFCVICHKELNIPKNVNYPPPKGSGLPLNGSPD